MAGPLPGGDKQAMIDAYSAAKQQNAPDADAAAEQAAGAPPDGDEGNMLGSNPEMKSLQLQVQHLEHVLVAKGILMPGDLITPPSPMPPAAPPMGAPPMGAPPAGLPPQ